MYRDQRTCDHLVHCRATSMMMMNDQQQQQTARSRIEGWENPRARHSKGKGSCSRFWCVLCVCLNEYKTGHQVSYRVGVRVCERVWWNAPHGSYLQTKKSASTNAKRLQQPLGNQPHTAHRQMMIQKRLFTPKIWIFWFSYQRQRFN